MSRTRAFRIRDVAAFIRVSHQRASRMYAEGKLPEPDQVDGYRAAVESGHDRAMGRAGVVGDAALEDARQS
jgi:hypothetical protein